MTAKDRVSKILFFCSVALVIFFYGILTRHYELFPYKYLRGAKQSAEALFEIVSSDSTGEAEADPLSKLLDLEGPTVRRRVEREDDGALILVSGGQGYFEAHNPGHGCLAWLMDRSGSIRHIWKYDPNVWGRLEKVTSIRPNPKVDPFGMHLFADGSLLVSYHSQETWPYGIGLAKFNKDSKLLWKKELLAHHWFWVCDDGRILTPSMRVVDSPYRIGNTVATINSKEGAILEDLVTILDSEGNVLEEISMLESMHRSGFIGLHHGSPYGGNPPINVQSWDPLHLNFVVRTDAETASRHAWLNEGDLLVSFCGLNAIAIVDAKTHRIKWISAGMMFRQHSPLFYQGGVLVLDNRGGDKELGETRLLKIDLESTEAKVLFPRSTTKLGYKLATWSRGTLDIHPDGRRVLVTSYHQGAVIECDPTTGELLWEYFYRDPKQPTKRCGINTAKYCFNVSFSMNVTTE